MKETSQQKIMNDIKVPDRVLESTIVERMSNLRGLMLECLRSFKK